MRIGVDFDNTIVCYDELFRKVSVERGLIPESTPASKGAVRDYLRKAGQEDIWTELQGYVYGERMREAAAFPGVFDFFRRCKQLSIPVFIISHRTRYPYLGERYDLHEAARGWLEVSGFFDPGRLDLSPERVHFELSKQDKIARIASVGCTHFIDDLPELLGDPGFAEGIERILFDPNCQHVDTTIARRLESWPAIDRLLLPRET